ncbi:PrpF protein [Hysterangium stoloniferum]|nr:PrpF protein [Hysterangium stoloniferum]
MTRPSSSSSTPPNPLPATFIRGGTSKGIFINRKHLPVSRSEWASIFLGIMGSPDPVHARQLNGMGGGVSSLSKIIVVGPPSPSQAVLGIDAEYTFAQVGIKDAEIDYWGNCGNLSSVAGVFAVDEGLCVPRLKSSISGDSIGTVRLWNTNTDKEIHTTFPVSGNDSHAIPSLDLEQVSIAGVPGKASQIILDFVNPAGARTGKLLPTGKAVDQITIPSKTENKGVAFTVSLVDATNPSVFVSSEDIFGSIFLPSEAAYVPNTSTPNELLETIEQIRKAGAEAMGLDPTAQAQPKIAIIGLPSRDSEPSPSPESDGIPVDMEVQAMSMGVLHRAIPMTVGLGLGVAAAIEGTVAHRIVSLARARYGVSDSGDIGSGEKKLKPGLVRIRHPSGVVDVGAEFAPDGSVTSAKVVRTGRRLMKGEVWW